MYEKETYLKLHQDNMWEKQSDEVRPLSYIILDNT